MPAKRGQCASCVPGARAPPCLRTLVAITAPPPPPPCRTAMLSFRCSSSSWKHLFLGPLDHSSLRPLRALSFHRPFQHYPCPACHLLSPPEMTPRPHLHDQPSAEWLLEIRLLPPGWTAHTLNSTCPQILFPLDSCPQRRQPATRPSGQEHRSHPHTSEPMSSRSPQPNPFLSARDHAGLLPARGAAWMI